MPVCERHAGQIDPAYGDCAVLHLESPWASEAQRQSAMRRDRARCMVKALEACAAAEQRAIHADTAQTPYIARTQRARAAAALHGHPELRAMLYPDK